MWGGLVSIADFSIEVGNPWEDPKTGETRGEFTLFMSCHWVIRDKSNIVITDEMQHIEEWVMQAEKFFNGKVIRRVFFDDQNHSLFLETKSNESLFLCPNIDEESEWTLFYVVPPEHRFWCTFDGASIKYND